MKVVRVKKADGDPTLEARMRFQDINNQYKSLRSSIDSFNKWLKELKFEYADEADYLIEYLHDNLIPNFEKRMDLQGKLMEMKNILRKLK